MVSQVMKSVSAADAAQPESLVGTVLAAIVGAVKAWAAQRAVAEELAGLDDRTVADLGLTRGDFPAIIAGTYRRGGEPADSA
jgi:uncharacterized protein YjiS (DUF1127 family)